VITAVNSPVAASLILTKIVNVLKRFSFSFFSLAKTTRQLMLKIEIPIDMKRNITVLTEMLVFLAYFSSFVKELYIVAVVQKRRKSIRGNYTGDNKNCPKLNP
jgi:hypothetical protein